MMESILNDVAGLCEVCPSVDCHLMVFPAHKRGSLQILVGCFSVYTLNKYVSVRVLFTEVIS